ncbi:MAG: hypothetical protein AAF311_07555 [Pseudomonadota bacterium]
MSQGDAVIHPSGDSAAEPTRLEYLFAAAVALSTLILFGYLFSAFLSKEISALGKTALALVSATIIMAVMLGEKRVSKPGKGLKRYCRAGSLAVFFLGVVFVFGTIQSVYALMEPRTVVESEAGKVERTVDQIAQASGLVDGTHRILAELPKGIWGERGCETVRYRFDVEGRVLTLHQIGVGAISSGELSLPEGDTVRSTTVTPAARRGQVTELTFLPGAIDTLRFDTRGNDAPIHFDRCGDDR